MEEPSELFVLGVARLLRYTYGGLLLTFLAVVVAPCETKIAVDALGPVLSPLAALGLGAAIYVVSRHVIGELALFRLTHSIHRWWDSKRQRATTSAVQFVQNLGVDNWEARSAYTAVRKQHLEPVEPRPLDVVHSELHMLYITSIETFIAAVLLGFQQRLFACVAMFVVFLVFLASAVAADIVQSQNECLVFKTRKIGIVEFLTAQGYLQSPGIGRQLLDCEERERNDGVFQRAKSMCQPYYNAESSVPGHDMMHVERVIKLASIISEGADVDQRLVRLAALLHDVGHRRTEGVELRDHATTSGKIAVEILENIPELGHAEVRDIVKAIRRHSDLNSASDSLLTRIVRDADRLDGMGAIGIMRTCMHRHRLPLYDAQRPFEVDGTSESKISTLVHALVRSVEWQSMLTVPKAMELGRTRCEFLVGFLGQLAKEIGCSEEDLATLSSTVGNALRQRNRVSVGR